MSEQISHFHYECQFLEAKDVCQKKDQRCPEVFGRGQWHQKGDLDNVCALGTSFKK